MNYHYTPFDPLVWLIFALFVICTFLIVKIYHHIYPNYPQNVEKETASVSEEKTSWQTE